MNQVAWAFRLILAFLHMVYDMGWLNHLRKHHYNLQEFQRFDIANLLWYTPSYLVPHNIPLLETKEKYISAYKKKSIVHLYSRKNLSPGTIAGAKEE